MQTERPYFLTNEEWYERIPLEERKEEDGYRGYRLTDKAPREAVESFAEFYSLVDGE